MDEEREEKKGFTVIDRRFSAQENGNDDQEENSKSKPTYVRELEQALEDKDRKLREYSAQHKKSMNEFEEAKARIRRDVGKEMERNRRSMLIDFLEVLDNLDRALKSADKEGESSLLIQGVAMVRDLFINKLNVMGVKRFEAFGQRFDPTKHEAMVTVPVSDSLMVGQVVEVILDGYSIGDEILRPASVAVAKQSNK